MTKRLVMSNKVLTFANTKATLAWRDGRVVDCGGLENR